jgi:GNAT superfamily N-acetyltransferase
MATSRSWRPSHVLDGPHPARLDEIDELNQIFSEAFTERYRRDGMVGVRVPHLNPAVWRYAIRDAADGAMVWRGERGDIVAFNIVHRSGVEGWMGPIAVRSEHQGVGAGKEIVRRGVDWLKAHGAEVIGLETMPRTMDNIGFYSAMGFLPGRLTLTTTVDASYADRPAPLFGRLSTREKDDVLVQCTELVASLLPGYDHSREIHLTDEHVS